MNSDLVSLASAKLAVMPSPIISEEEITSAFADQPEIPVEQVIRTLEGDKILFRASRTRFFYVPGMTPKLDDADPDVIFSAASQTVSPSYLGWASAAYFHGLTTREADSVYVASEESRNEITLFGREVRYQKVPTEKFYGIETRKEFGLTFIVTDEMRTLLDCIDRPEICGGWSEVARILWESKYIFDPHKLVNYATRYPSTQVKQKLGFLLDTLDMSFPEEARNNLKSHLEGDLGYRTIQLGNGSEPQQSEQSMGLSEDWKVRTNFSKKQIMSVIDRLP